MAFSGNGINTKMQIKVAKFFKNSQWCVVNWTDSYKDPNTQQRIYGQKYALWIDNKDVWDKITKGATIKIKYFTAIKFKEEYTKDKAEEIVNTGNKSVINLNCVVEVIAQAVQPSSQSNTFNFQDYSDIEQDFGNIIDSDIDLPY